MALSKAPHAKCSECSLAKYPFVPTYAPKDAKYAVIGEGPGYQETNQGVPFVGESGRLLSAVFKNNDIPYDRVWRSNVVACRPPNNREPVAHEIKCCKPRLFAELKEFEGDTILPMGKVAGETILAGAGYDPNMKISERRGHLFDWNGKTIVPTWHPAYVLRRPSEALNFFGDVERAIKGRVYHKVQEQPEVVWINTLSELVLTLNEVHEGAWVAFDLETDQVMWYDRPDEPADAILMLGLAWSDDIGYIVHPDLLYDSEMARDTLNNFFARTDLTFVAQNGKFDVLFLRTVGVHARVDFDTMLAHYVLHEEGPHGLKGLALKYFDLEDYEQGLVQKYLKSRNDRYSKVPYEDLGTYCAWDCCVTKALADVLGAQLYDQGLIEWPFKQILMRAQDATTEVEWNGMMVDAEYVDEWYDRLEAYAESLADEMRKIADDPELNPRSYQQVADVIYNERGIEKKRIRGLSPISTAKKALAHVREGQDEFVDTLRLYRRVHKMLRSYLKNLRAYADINGRVHSSILLHGTEVGRLSFRSPALQTIPRPYEDVYGAIVRGAFVAAPGHKLVVADYSQAELRVAAVLSGEPFLLEVYKEGRDLHSEVAIAMYGEEFTKEQRVMTKMFNFSYLYGGSEYSFAEDAGLDIDMARRFVRDYNKTMPVLAEWKQEQLRLARTQGYVQSPFGRKRRFPLITQTNLQDVRKAAGHAPVAGTASDITLLSLCRLVESGWKVVLTVHDSIVVEVPEDQIEMALDEVVTTMSKTGEEFFPEVPWKVDAEVRDRWSPLPEEVHPEQVKQTFWKDSTPDTVS